MTGLVCQINFWGSLKTDCWQPQRKTLAQTPLVANRSFALTTPKRRATAMVIRGVQFALLQRKLASHKRHSLAQNLEKSSFG